MIIKKNNSKDNKRKGLMPPPGGAVLTNTDTIFRIGMATALAPTSRSVGSEAGFETAVAHSIVPVVEQEKVVSQENPTSVSSIACGEKESEDGVSPSPSWRDPLSAPPSKENKKEDEMLRIIRDREKDRKRFEQQASPYPFLDKSRCWRPQEFFEHNLALLRAGLSGRLLEDELCRWLGDGRIALYAPEGEGVQLVVRYLENGLIRYSYHRPQAFPFKALLPKSEAEMMAEKRKLARQLGLQAPSIDCYSDEEFFSESESSEEEEEKETDSIVDGQKHLVVNPIKEVPFHKLLRDSMWTRWFERRIFDPSLLKEGESETEKYDAYSPKARTLNTFCGFRWSTQELEQMAPEFDTEEARKRVEAIARMVAQVACRGDSAKLDYVLKYFLSIYLRPWEPLHAMPMLVGPQGCGKSSFMRIFGTIFGSHYRYIAELEDVVGDYTAIVKDTVLAFADEAKVRRNSKAAAKLKSIITECQGALRVREMRRDVSYTDNFLNLVGAIDNLSDFQIDLRGRRFYVLHFSDCRINDQPYFEALEEAIKGEDFLGLRGFLHLMIRTVDLSDFGRGGIPSREKQRSLRTLADEMCPFDPFEIWIAKALDRGYTVRRLDDNSGLNDHTRWLDDHGRTGSRREEGFVCEVSSEALYRQMRQDVPELRRLSDCQMRRGLERFLHPACRGQAIRRSVRYEDNQNGLTILRKAKRTYLTLLRPEQCAEILGLPANIDDDDDDTEEKEPPTKRRKEEEKDC